MSGSISKNKEGIFERTNLNEITLNQLGKDIASLTHQKTF